MLNAPLKLNKARVLITNDDGVSAPGIRLLEKLIRPIAKEVWVVAPETEQSATGHSLTIRRPLRIHKLGPRRFAVDGTPTDSVLMAVNKVMEGALPDLVLSGVNAGGNLGEDTTYSGTVSAAMEATLLGYPAIALSQFVNGDTGPGWGKLHWDATEGHAVKVIKKLVSTTWPRDVFINVNFPATGIDDVTGIEVTREGRRKIGDQIVESKDPRGDSYYWIGAQQRATEFSAGTDLEAVHRGAISVTPMSMDLTHRPTMKALNKVF